MRHTSSHWKKHESYTFTLKEGRREEECIFYPEKAKTCSNQTSKNEQCNWSDSNKSGFSETQVLFLELILPFLILVQFCFCPSVTINDIHLMAKPACTTDLHFWFLFSFVSVPVLQSMTYTWWQNLHVLLTSISDFCHHKSQFHFANLLAQGFILCLQLLLLALASTQRWHRDNTSQEVYTWWGWQWWWDPVHTACPFSKTMTKQCKPNHQNLNLICTEKTKNQTFKTKQTKDPSIKKQ